MALLLALRTQNVTVDSKAFAELPVPTLKSNTTIGTNNKRIQYKVATPTFSNKKGNSKQY